MSFSESEIVLHSPAKVNLYLAVTGVRDDGFHELLSLVAPLEFGDTLTVSYKTEAGPDTLACNFPDVPTDHTNLVLRAAGAFREHVSVTGHFRFELEKRVPAGAGLGGGSSNAATALRAINQLTGDTLDQATLCQLAAAIGSDCPLFIREKATVMSGRGEILTPLPPQAARSLESKPLLLFRPDFGVPTAWAYQKLKAAQGALYISPEKASEEISKWLEQPCWNTIPLQNNLQAVVFRKYLALPTLLEQLNADFNLRCMMSGSGSCCFALPDDNCPLEQVKGCIQDAWGEDAFIVETAIAGSS